MNNKLLMWLLVFEAWSVAIQASILFMLRWYYKV